jgi:hypothetical protein
MVTIELTEKECKDIKEFIAVIDNLHDSDEQWTMDDVECQIAIAAKLANMFRDKV